MTHTDPHVRARSYLALGLLALVGTVAVACGPAATVAPPQAAPAAAPNNKRTAQGDVVPNADPAALGRIVADLVPVKATTTTVGGDSTVTTKPGDPPSSPTTTPTTPPVVVTPPQTLPPTTPRTTPRTVITSPPTTKPQPTLYSAPLSSEESALYNKLMQVTGKSLQLDAALMAAAQARSQSYPSNAVPYLTYKAGTLNGVGMSAQAIVDNPSSAPYLPNDGSPYNYVGVGAVVNGSRIDLYYIISVI